MNTHTSYPLAGPAQSHRQLTSQRRWLFATALAAVLAAAGFTPSDLVPAARAHTTLPPTAPIRPDRILVKPNAGADLNALHLAAGTQVLRTFPDIGNLQVLQLPAGKIVAEVIGIYQASGLVEYAEPDFIVQALATPNDFRYWDGSLWNLHNTGQLGGKPDADVDAPEAWDTQNSASNIVVAVLDTGVRLTHEDLAPNLWVNPGESGLDSLGLDKRTNVRDDDGDGFIDDVHGINTLNGTGIPSDDYGHGTHVSGTLGAVGNNGVGVVGVAWRVQIMACKFLDATGQGSISDAITCIDYARGKGAKIINASWGSYTFNSAGLRDAIASTRAAGMIFVAACGNDNNDNDVNPLYPASYDLDNIIAVAATTRTDDRATWSNFGATKVHLGAPALDVFSCWSGSDSDYRWFSGTSMGAPHVVGTCALLWTRYPAESYRQIINRVLAGVDPLPALAGKTVTGGRLNLQKALGAPANVVADFTASPASGAAPLTVQFSDASTGAVASRDWNFGDGTAHSTAPNPVHTYANPGNYTAKLTVTGVNGSTSSKSQVISVVANYTVQSTTFAWIDPAGMATVSLADDGVSAPLALPFAFNFYGRDYTQFHLGANGLIGFNNQSMSSLPNTDLPNSAAPNAIVCPYWADLNPAAGGSVRVGVTGSAPNRRVVVSWVDVPVKGSLVMTRFTFQAVLHEGSNRILCQYQQIEPNRTAGELQTGTVGIENESGTVAAKFTYNENPATLANNSALLFTPTAAARMAVTPGGGVSSAGNQGGPFSPSSQTYTVASTGSAPLHWSAGVNQSWVTLSSTGGTLSPGQSANVKITINSQANALTPGTYTATVTFSNLDTGEGNTTRDVTLTVNQVATAALGVVPSTGFASQGPQGGPFSPDSKVYTLTNTGNATLNWTAFKNQTWVSLSATSGMLAPGASATVTVSINQSANSLATGTYRATVRFFNTTTGQGNTSREVTLKVQKRPRLAAGYEPTGALLSLPLFQIHLLGEPNELYAIQTATNLAGWSDMAVNRADDQGAVTVTDPVASLFKQRFYRGYLVPDPIGPIGTDIVPAVRTDRILVKPIVGGDLTALHLLTGVRVLHTFPAIGNLQVLELPAGQTVAAVLAVYQQSFLVQYAEPDAIVQALAEPNDFRFQDGSLWHLHNLGQLGGMPDADIDAPEAWDMQTAATNVVIAVVDTGVRYTHEDLAANMWVNPGEIPGNGADDDGDGFVDNVHGINAVTGSGNPMDDHGHGTHVSGIMGAVGNNSVGVVGPSWRTRIMALKALDAQGNGAISDAIRCIDFARSRRVQLINASWGTPGFNSAALKDAIASARDADIIFVAACGNSAEDNGVNPVYPASYDLDNIVSVAATTRSDSLASFSNHGATNVHLAAPGSPIYSCWGSADDAYQYFDGTSMAAALTSGATALCRSRFPNESYRQIINRLLAGTDPLPSLAGKCTSGGRLNLQKVLGAATPPPLPTVTITATDATAAEPSDTGTFTVTRTGDTSAGLTVSYAIGGTANNGGDYQTLPSSVTIPAGSSSSTIPVMPIDDSLPEGSETVVLTLAASATYTVGSPDSATATIADNDQAPEINILGEYDQRTGTGVSIASGDTTPSTTDGTDYGNVSVSSGLAVKTFRIQNTGTATLTITLPLTMTGPHAADFSFTQPPASSISAGGGVNFQVFFDPSATGLRSATVNISNNDSDENPYTFAIQGTGVTGGELEVRGNDVPIADGDTTPSTADGTDFGGAVAGTGSVSRTFTLHNSGLDTATLGPVTITGANPGDFSVTQQPGSSLSGGNSFTSFIVQFAPSADATGVRRATVSFTNSDEDENPYDFAIQGTATTTPPPPTVTIVATDANAAEPNDAGTFTVSRSGDTGAGLTVSYSTGGSASNGGDYQTLSGSVTIPAGSSSATITVTPMDDSAEEGSETVVLTLAASAAYSVGSPGSATVTIADNDSAPPPLPTVTVTATDANASETGPNTGTYSITRSGDTSTALTVNYTLGGTAGNGSDYQSLPTSVTIPAGASSANVTVTPIDDSAVEGSETVVLTLNASAAYTVGSPGNATVTIADNDSAPPPLPTVSVTAADANASETGPDPGQFTVTRSGSTSVSLTVNYTLGGTAGNGADYQSLPTSVTIPAGASSATVTVRPINDSAVEGNETVVLTLNPNAAYTIGSLSSAVVTIADNDSASPPLVADFTASPNSGPIPLRVQFTDQSTGNPVAWSWSFGDGFGTTDQNPSHTYLLPGNFTATLTVIGSNGATSSKSQTIQVRLLP